ncbi:hypothetical protein KUV51_12375 [Tateyamaria omphalii]|uniref:hypothetical protein n=1 Tax=Tateyamaria omphalii TaxID=299262 RepID=UPI001C98F27D|nr:hypothetical protein [Tateyamaria omphalii]MBY5933798.1 hypothetical protein [Tateyamaria omphalii]
MANNQMNKTKDVVRVGDLQLGSTKASNLFLRALWAVLRSQYGKLGWQYTPRRTGEAKRISFGYMSLGTLGAGQIGVSIEYETRGIVRNICFEIEDCTVYPPKELANSLENSVAEAMRFMQNPVQRKHSTYVTTSTGVQLAAYCGQNWKCIPINDKQMEISIEVEGFDEADCNHEFVVRLDQLLDAFAFMTNDLFSMTEKLPTGHRHEPDAVNIYLIEEDWLDDYSFEGEHLRLARSQVEYCDRLVANKVESEQSIKAARLFHGGLRLLKQASTNNDIAGALFVSAIEAISLPLAKSERCDTCKQPIFGIAQRVSEVTRKHLGEHIARIFKQDYYTNRSKFLHTGHVQASLPMIGYVFPQLDPSGVEGCSVPTPFGNPKNLLEYTSFILRREIEIIAS